MLSTTTTAQDDWDAHWDEYAESASHNPAQLMRHDLIARLLAPASAPMRLFDIGSGQGDLVAMLAARLPAGTEFLGAELSESGVRISQCKVPRASFVAADLFAPPPALAGFAGWASHAVCSEVLEHVDDPAELLRRAGVCLADGAQIIVTVPGGPMSAFDRHIGHRTHFTRASISAILERAGFAVDRTLLAGFPFFNLYRLLVIARGRRLADDVRTGGAGAMTRLAETAMRLFGVLFRWNTPNSAFGWQVVAVARKRPS